MIKSIFKAPKKSVTAQNTKFGGQLHLILYPMLNAHKFQINSQYENKL